MLTKTTKPTRRRGMLLSLEMVIALPILILVFVGAVEFTFLLLASQAITAAANVGARQATLPSATSADVEDAVYAALSSWRWANSPDLQVQVYVLPDNDTLLQNAITGTPVQVTITMPSTTAAPDLLGIIPVLSIKNQTLTSTFVSRKE
ncbi:MAG TPA: TadE family protein [Pirellulaceae bacterium]|nr:TadE family protein [Pirellulaceae bacterium]